MAALRHLAAIRARLLSSPELVSILATTPDGDPAVYLGNIFAVRESVYPCVTIGQSRASMGVWATRIVDPGYVVIECFSKKDVLEPSTMEELVEGLLHVQKTLVSSANACFHEIRKLDWNTAFWDSDTGAWRCAAMYLVRVSLS